MVSVTDNIHAVAYDAVIIKVMPHVRMANISTRAAIGIAQNVAIAGFIINGESPKRVMVRALGPSLTPFGVAGALADPMLDLRDGAGNQIAPTTIGKTRSRMPSSRLVLLLGTIQSRLW